MQPITVLSVQLPNPDAYCIASAEQITLVVDPRIPERTLAAIITRAVRSVQHQVWQNLTLI
ncbi:hypothetical protein SAMN04489726_8029 [Allokutzneria albata]|uniref:Uncharacterized protein n=1 Tax=Allokutzneria albata TaxID=211114 RepID=A0A1H0DW34_ALLAB|nr:hypothetical protein SAMN04489726_8029 [Allokutzneria albata]